MNNKPLVSIGMPAYNSERFIADAINSVLLQTYKNFELIITDDGSTDNTVSIVKSFKDPRIKVFSDGCNRGISYRLNQQIDIAEGQFFARMDSDDLMMPERIEKQIEYLTSHPDISITASSIIIIDDDNSIIGYRGDPDSVKAFSREKWVQGYSFPHPSVTGRLSFFKKFKYRDKFKGVEDIDLWLRALDTEKMIILPNFLMFYRDPLKFKLKTYVFRRKQSESLYKTAYKETRLSTKTMVWLIAKSKIKTLLTYILSFMGLDSLMISRRNMELKNSGEYFSLLNKLIKNNQPL